MKKFLLFALLLTTIVLFEFCSGSKKAQKSTATVSYASEVQHVVATNCSPCHVGSNPRQTSLGSYDAVKNNIDEIITRISKNPDEKGFMPFKHAKLPDSTIQVFVNWRANGFMQ